MPMMIVSLLVLLLPLVAFGQTKYPITVIGAGTTGYVDTVVFTGAGVSTFTVSNRATGGKIGTLTITGGGTGGSGSITNITSGNAYLTISGSTGPVVTVTFNVSDLLTTNVAAGLYYPLGSNPSNYVSLAQVWSAGALSNNWTGGPITLDSANSQENTYGGELVIGGNRFQANGGVASGNGSWANNRATASGLGSWANLYATASGEGSWAHFQATASGEGSFAIGPGAKATNGYDFVWSDGTAIGSTAGNQFTVYARNGIRLLGGPITGNGSNMTNVNAATLGGVALAGLVQTNSALDALRLNNGVNLTNLNLVGSGGSTNITGGGTWTLSSGVWTYAPTGITTAVQSALDGKLPTNGNAVGLVSGAQVGTMTITNLTTEGSQTLNGTANLAPNQTASSTSSLLTRSLGDARYLTNNHTAAVTLGNILSTGGSTPSILAGTGTTFPSDGPLRVGINMVGGTNGFFNLAGSAPSSTMLGGGVLGENYRRVRIDAGGTFYFGLGTAAADALLSLSSRSNLLAAGTWTFNAAAGNGSGLTNLPATGLRITNAFTGAGSVLSSTDGTNLYWKAP